jgi:GTP-binding protein
VLLLVDAVEGPMPQTRFVLKKALERGHRAIVVINKMDRKEADPDRALNLTFDLFIELGASEQQANFPFIYTNAITGEAGITPDLGNDLYTLIQAILEHIPAPDVDMDAPFQMLVSNLSYDDHRGNTAVGRISAGSVTSGQQLTRIGLDGQIYYERARYLYTFDGLKRNEVQVAQAGEIIAIAGLDNITIGETLADAENPTALPPIHVEEPTVQMMFGVNTSPLSGKEGRWGTSRKLRERLMNELRNNVALRVLETDSPDTFIVSGRGELHLAILIETMRREGYEFQVSSPEVIYKHDDAGDLCEPFEEVHIDVPPDSVGMVVEMLGSRRGVMQDMINSPDNTVHLTYLAPTRGLLGFRHQFLSATHGTGVMNTLFHGYLPLAGPIISRGTHSITAWEDGLTTSYGLKNAEERGVLFVGVGVEVYEGMVIGETQKQGDVVVNVSKKKHLTNMRQSNKDIEVRLTQHREMSLDEAIEFLAEDELLEVTPQNFRIRKKILQTEERGKENKKVKEALAFA